MSGCPAFSADGPAGIADALRSVDCMAGAATAQAFGRLFGPDGALGTALTICLTLYVALLALNLLTGRSTLNLSALTPRMMGLGLVLTFATSWVAYQSVAWNLLVGAPDQIASLLVGTRGSATMLFASRLDILFSAVADAAEAASMNADKAQSFTPADLLWLAALMLLLGTVGVLIVSRIALAALLALGPVFILLALFRGTRGLFEGWLKAAVLFAVVPLFTVLIGGGTLAMMAPVIRSLAMAGEEPSLRLAVTVFLAAAVYCALMAMVLKVATTLTAGWRINLAGERPVRDREAAPVAPLSATAVAPSSISHAAAGSDRVRAITIGLAPAANDATPAAISHERLRIVPTAIPISPAAPAAPRGDERVRGFGRSFRTPVRPTYSLEKQP